MLSRRVSAPAMSSSRTTAAVFSGPFASHVSTARMSTGVASPVVRSGPPSPARAPQWGEGVDSPKRLNMGVRPEGEGAALAGVSHGVPAPPRLPMLSLPSRAAVEKVVLGEAPAARALRTRAASPATTPATRSTSHIFFLVGGWRNSSTCSFHCSCDTHLRKAVCTWVHMHAIDCQGPALPLEAASGSGGAGSVRHDPVDTMPTQARHAEEGSSATSG